MKDKCLCSILVLFILSNGYKVNLDSLTKDLKLGIKKLQDISKVLGFHVKKEVVTLSLPLPAPVSTVRRKKR